MATDRGEWFEEEAFWEHYAPIMFESERWAESPAVVDGLERLCALAPRSRVLDLCCGMGRISVELARRGHVVCGVDLCQSYLDAAREYAGDIGLELVHADARQFVRPASFDLAVNLYTSFGYFDDPADDALVIRNLAESLAGGGQLVIEILGKETAVRDFTPGERFSRGGFEVTTRFEVVDAWAGLRNTWHLERDGEIFERSFVQRLYSGTGMRRLLLENGFEQVDLFGDWDGRPYDQRARVLIARARKAFQ